MSTQLQIAIDGPVAAGKSTVARALADRLKFIYIDTGAMYRCVALAAAAQGISWDDELALAALASTLDIQLLPPDGATKDGRSVTVLLDGSDVSWKIREPEMGSGASKVSQYRGVREALVAKQQALAKGKQVVMEGRDICLVVLPQAELKIYLTANDDVRIDRALALQRARGTTELDRETVRKQLQERDARDMQREVDRLQVAPDAWLFDTSELSLEEVIARIEEKARTLLA